MKRLESIRKALWGHVSNVPVPGKTRERHVENVPHEPFPDGLLALFIPIVVLILLAAAPPPDTLLDQANAAMAAGNFTRAIELYEKADLRTDDPGRVTLDLAVAQLQRALRDDSASDLNEAEQLFNCLLDEREPRRPLALFGVGNCELQKAGERDADAALAAIEAYEQCLRSATDDKLIADARYNLERARLLLSQIRKAQDEKPPEPEPGNGNDPNPKPPKNKPPEHKPKPANGSTDPGAGQKPVGPSQAKPPDHGDKPKPTNDPPPPGSGPLRPVPENPDLPPLSPNEALEHLKQANERIWRERHQHRLGLAKPPAEDVRDW